MKITTTLVLEESARRDHFNDNQVGILPDRLAEIRRLPVADQCFEHRLFFGAADVDLDVAAAGVAASVVGRAAWRIGAGARDLRERQRAARYRGRVEPAGDQPLAVHNREAIAAKPARGGRMRHGSDPPRESVRRAAHVAFALAGGEKTAGDVDGGIAPEFAVTLEHWSEVDPLCVAEEPGRVMIFVAFDSGDANGNVQGTAMPPKSAARWGGQ